MPSPLDLHDAAHYQKRARELSGRARDAAQSALYHAKRHRPNSADSALFDATMLQALASSYYKNARELMGIDNEEA